MGEPGTEKVFLSISEAAVSKSIELERVVMEKAGKGSKGGGNFGVPAFPGESWPPASADSITPILRLGRVAAFCFCNGVGKGEEVGDREGDEGEEVSPGVSIRFDGMLFEFGVTPDMELLAELELVGELVKDRLGGWELTGERGSELGRKL